MELQKFGKYEGREFGSHPLKRHNAQSHLLHIQYLTLTFQTHTHTHTCMPMDGLTL